jgi:hypothetical protein
MIFALMRNSHEVDRVPRGSQKILEKGRHDVNARSFTKTHQNLPCMWGGRGLGTDKSQSGCLGSDSVAHRPETFYPVGSP